MITAVRLLPSKCRWRIATFAVGRRRKDRTAFDVRAATLGQRIFLLVVVPLKGRHRFVLIFLHRLFQQKQLVRSLKSNRDVFLPRIPLVFTHVVATRMFTVQRFFTVHSNRSVRTFPFDRRAAPADLVVRILLLQIAVGQNVFQKFDQGVGRIGTRTNVNHVTGDANVGQRIVLKGKTTNVEYRDEDVFL